MLSAPSIQLHAASATWQGAAGTQPWNASGNWVGGNIPGSTSITTTIDDATFNGTLGGASAITIDANRNIRKILFTSTTLSYTLGSDGANAGYALLISNNGVVGIASNVASAVAQTVNAPLIFQGTVGEIWSDSSTTAAIMTFNGNISYAGNSSMTLGLRGRNTGNNTVNGAISDGSGGGTVGINKAGQNTTLWVLSGTNAYTGSTVVTGGILRAGSTQAFGSNSTVILGSTTAGVTAELDLNGNSNTVGSLATVGSALSNGTVKLGSGTLTINGTNGSAVDFKGVISGTGGVTKNGSGIQTFSGANTYTGATTVTAGTLKFAKEVSLYNNTPASWTATNLVVNSGATAIFNVGGAGEFTASDIATLAALGTGTGGFKSGSSIGLDTTGGNFTYGTAIANTNSGGNVIALTKFGTNVLTLTGNNTYTGATTITAGTLQVDGSTASGSQVNVGTAGTLAGTGTISGNATLTGNGTINKSSGTIAGTLAVTGGNWNGNGTVTGAVTSSSGNFTIGSGANLTANGGMNVTGGTLLAGDSTSKITGNVSYTSSSNSTFQGTIAGSGKTLTMNATGTLTLSGNNTYTGSTNVTAGTLLANNTSGSATGSGNVTVASGAILGGNGTIGGATTIAGILSPGDGGIGTLNITGNVTWQGASSNGTATDWIFQLGASPTSDLLNITGNFLKDTDAGAGTNFRFNFEGASNTGTFKVVDWTGTSSFDASDFGYTNLGSGLTGSFSINGSQLDFSVLPAVPEPSTWVAMAALIIAGGTMAMRRRSRSATEIM